MADNGSLFVFGDEKNIAYLQVEFDKKFNLLNSIVYRKINALTIKGIMEFNSFAPITERILFYDKGDRITMHNPFADYLREEFTKAKITNKQIAELFPSASGGLTGCVSNWLNGENIMTKEQYLKVRQHLNGEYLRKEYEDLRKEYEDLRRPFNNQFRLTDVIDAKLKSSFHPTTKDGAVIEKLILTTTKENDLVFSPFLGSGTDAIACIRTKRRLIGCELDNEYFDKMCKRIEEELRQGVLF
jgi:site-specific DNA-methyltransferase (adenine-specific)